MVRAEGGAWLFGTYALLVCASFVGCGATPRASPQGDSVQAEREAKNSPRGEASLVGRPASSSFMKRVRVLMRITEEIRGLKFKKDVPVRTQTDREIVAYVEKDLEEEELEQAKALYVTLGLVEPDTNVKDLILRVLGEQVIGYYDPKAKILVVRESVSQAKGAAVLQLEMVLVHELVHALQDQYLGLGRLVDKDWDSDAGNAFRAVVEGDATLAMLGHAASFGGVSLETLVQNPDAFAQMEAQAEEDGQHSELGQAPPILRYTLLSSYVDGLRFVAKLYALGGWAGVNGAYRRLPSSMEQVLHPEVYQRKEGPGSCTMPVFSKEKTGGFSKVIEDVLGELELSVYLGQDKPEGIDRIGAKGWSCDRIRLLENSSRKRAVVWWSLWDDLDAAKRVEATMKRVASQAKLDKFAERAPYQTFRPCHLS